MAAQKWERSRGELTWGASQMGQRDAPGSKDSRQSTLQREEHGEYDKDSSSRNICQGQENCNSYQNIRAKDYIVEHSKHESQQDGGKVRLEAPKLSRRSSLRCNPRYDNSSDKYTHKEEDLEENISEDDFNRSLLIAQSVKNTKKKTNSVRFKLDLGEVSDECGSTVWRRRKHYADSVISDTDQSLNSSRGIIRNTGCLSDRTGYRSKEMEFEEGEHTGSRTWRPGVGVEVVPDEIDVIELSRNDNGYVTDDVTDTRTEDRDCLQSASKTRQRLLQEKRRPRGIVDVPEGAGLSGEESEWVPLPSVFRDDSDLTVARVKRNTSGRRRRRKRRSERCTEKPRIEKVLSDMSMEAKLAIDAILAEMEQEKGGQVVKHSAQEQESRDRKQTILRENCGKNTSFDDGIDSGFQDMENVNSRSSGSEDLHKNGERHSNGLGRMKNGDLLKCAANSERYRPTKPTRSRTPTKFPLIHAEMESYYAYDDGVTESSVPSRQNIPGLGTYRFPRMREKTFKITPPGYDSRYAELPRYEPQPAEEPDASITAKAKEKCNQWLDQQYLPTLP